MGPGTELASNSFGVDSGERGGPAFHEVTGRKAELRLLPYPLESTDVKMELGVLICSNQPLLVTGDLGFGNRKPRGSSRENRDFIN